METVEVVIRIPKREIEGIKRYCRRTEIKISSLEDYIYRSIANGTVLPKGHGRLIDARAFETAMYHQAFETDSDMQKWDSGCWIRYKMFENAICDASTILEADKEVGNG